MSNVEIHQIGKAAPPARILARVCSGQSYFRCLLRLIMFFFLSSSGTFLYAQTIEIKLVNGRSGDPISDTCVNVWVGTARKDAMSIPTDENGIARFRLTDKESEIDLQNRWKGCGDFGMVNPVVKYDDILRINAGFVSCQSRPSDHSWLAISDISTKEVLQRGVVTANTCGKATASPKPREVVLFVRPLTWWEKLKQ
jgi:hypothetical protein